MLTNIFEYINFKMFELNYRKGKGENITIQETKRP